MGCHFLSGDAISVPMCGVAVIIEQVRAVLIGHHPASHVPRRCYSEVSPQGDPAGSLFYVRECKVAERHPSQG